MIRKLLLAALIAVPICYYFALIVGAATYPGYSHVTRYASELDAADSPYPKAAAWQAGYDSCRGVRDGELRWESGWCPDQAAWHKRVYIVYL